MFLCTHQHENTYNKILSTLTKTKTITSFDQWSIAIEIHQKLDPQGTFIKKHLHFQCSHVHNVKRDSCDVPFHRKKRMREMSCTVHGTTDDRLNIML